MQHVRKHQSLQKNRLHELGVKLEEKQTDCACRMRGNTQAPNRAYNVIVMDSLHVVRSFAVWRMGLFHFV